MPSLVINRRAFIGSLIAFTGYVALPEQADARAEVGQEHHFGLEIDVPRDNLDTLASIMSCVTAYAKQEGINIYETPSGISFFRAYTPYGVPKSTVMVYFTKHCPPSEASIIWSKMQNKFPQFVTDHSNIVKE